MTQTTLRAKFRLLLRAGFIFAITTLAQGRVQPTSGFDLFSPQEEIQAGQQSAAEVARQLPLLPESSPITKYVQKLGHELAAHAPGEKWPYSFRVINQKEINAFALPGGPIFINLGTIQAADNEAELAGVLAHEISHVVQRHGTRAASKQMAAELPLAIIGSMMGRSTLAQMAQLGLSFGVGSYFLKNSRQSESEADLLGTDIMYDTGFDPHAMAEFFAKLEAQDGKQGAMAQFLSDHPNPGNRAGAVSQEVSTLPAKTYRSNSAEFQKVKERVAGLQPMTAEQIAAWQKSHSAASQPASSPNNEVTAESAMKTLDHEGYTISYPENWQVASSQNKDGNAFAITITPSNGISHGEITGGVVIDRYELSSANTNLKDATNKLVQSLCEANPGMHAAGNVTSIRVNGIEGKSIDLIGNSPAKDSSGNAVREHDWVVSIPRSNSSLLYFVFIAPESKFDMLRPTFEQMLKSVQIR